MSEKSIVGREAKAVEATSKELRRADPNFVGVSVSSSLPKKKFLLFFELPLEKTKASTPPESKIFIRITPVNWFDSFAAENCISQVSANPQMVTSPSLDLSLTVDVVQWRIPKVGPSPDRRVYKPNSSTTLENYTGY
jgi:hypothetical protein